MTEVVALVTQESAASEDEWRSALSAGLPDEWIVPFRMLDRGQRALVKIAIVANPDPSDIAALPSLVWIQSLWAGVERLVGELGAAAPHIVRLVDPAMAQVMAEAVLAWTYYLHREMPAYARQQRDRSWAPRPYRTPSEMTVGLLGLGALGSAAAERLAAAGFNVVGWSRSLKSLPNTRTYAADEGFASVLALSDILVCLLPLTAETRGLMNAERFAAMKAGAALINFGRGPVVVIADLLEALDAGRLSHAVLDVFEQEPLPAASMLWTHPDVTVLPHVSGPTDRRTAAAIVARNIRLYRETGSPPTGVNLQRGY